MRTTTSPFSDPTNSMTNSLSTSRSTVEPSRYMTSARPVESVRIASPLSTTRSAATSSFSRSRVTVTRSAKGFTSADCASAGEARIAASAARTRPPQPMATTSRIGRDTSTKPACQRTSGVHPTGGAALSWRYLAAAVQPCTCGEIASTEPSTQSIPVFDTPAGQSKERSTP